MISIGCCGWAESQDKYYRHFGIIEVQETFYRPGRLQKYERWKAGAPAGFQFAVKAWQLITHEPSSPTYRRLKTPAAVSRKNRYGSFRPTDEVLAAWEVTPRGDWDPGEIKRLCSTLDLVHGVDPFKARPVHGRIRYYRLHGRPGYDLRHRYTMQDLRELLRMADRNEVCVLFNNRSMLRDAQRLRRLIAQI
jgi:uncharacterized protein YecE (DUF72 family)